MRRRLFVLGMLLWAWPAWPQCQPTNNPTLDTSNSTVVPPNKVPFAAVTVALSASDGTSTSHGLTIGAGTKLQISISEWNTQTSDLYYAFDNNAWTYWFQADGTARGSGGFHNSWAFADTSSWAGHIFHMKMVGHEKPGSGSFTPTTQDINNLTVTSQAPGIYQSDGIPINGYQLVNLAYSGTPNIPYQTTCTNAAEKDMLPTAQLQLANVTSGENRNGVTFQGATTVVGQPVYATAYDYISVLPGDDVQSVPGGFVYCTALGTFWNTSMLQDIEFEVALTASYVSSLTRSDGWHPEAYYCSDRTSPPDWVGPYKASANTSSGEYWGAEFMYREVPWGQSFTNVPWQEGFSFISQPKIVPPNATAPDCTNYDKGYKTGRQVFFPGPIF